MAIPENILILPFSPPPLFLRGLKTDHTVPKEIYVYKELKNEIPLFNTFNLRYDIAIHVNILVLPVFGVSFLRGLKKWVPGVTFFCKDL